ncbi:MAG: efflux transporter outer membrane subunit [Burkholderiaceae bacterium]
MNTPPKSVLAAALAAAVLAGCADMRGIEPRAQLRDAAALGLPAAPALAPAPDWWVPLGDAQLDRLVAQALQDNPSLRAASARVAKADSTVAVVQAADGPQLNGTLGLNRQRFSSNYIYPPPLGGSVQNLGNAQLQGGWALDFFGRNEGQLKAALGQARAVQAEHDAARVLLATNVVRTYVQWARLHDQHALAEQALAQRRQMLQLAHERARAGLDNQLAVRQNESSQADTRTQIAALEQQMQATGHALAALLGAPSLPAGVTAPSLAALHALAVPQQLSADWLGRRADIAAARWRVQAAQGQVQAARAQFYPNINLAGFVGLQSLGFDKLLRGGSAEWGVGPALSLPIFEGGRLRGQLRGAVADEDAAIESYNATVIGALREVADEALAVRAVARQQHEQAPALQAAEAAWDIARQRYGAGLGTYLNVLVADAAVLAQRRQSVDLSAQALLAQVGLAQAMGGGWQPTTAAPQNESTGASAR